MENLHSNDDTKTHLFDELSVVNRQIGEILRQKPEQRRLQLRSEGENLLGDLHVTKNSLLVSLLQLRKQGENGIELVITGKKEDELHAYSRNELSVLDVDSSYRTKSTLSQIRKFLAGDLLTLIGNPDGFIEENTNSYIIRTVIEMIEISHATDESRIDYLGDGFMRKNSLNKLKSTLAGRLLKLRVDRIVSAEELEISYLKDRHNRVDNALIEINYFNSGRKWGSHLLGSEYNRNLELQKLIDQCGGFDRRGRRKKHY